MTQGYSGQTATPQKTCPSCGQILPLSAVACFRCGLSYQGGAQRWRSPDVVGTNTLAVVALCLGIGSFFLGVIAAIPAIIVGYMARRQIDEGGGEGRGLATAGIVLGWIGVAITVIFIVIIIGVASSAPASPGP